MENEKEVKKEKVKYFSDGEAFAMFIIPPIGFMVYATTLNSNPEKAKRALGISMAPLILIVAFWVAAIIIKFATRNV